MKENTIKLEKVIIDIAAGPFGSNLKVSCFVDDGFPIIDGANLKGFKVTDNITKFVTEEKANSLYRSIAHRNDVVVTISGTLGQIAYIPEDSMYEAYLCSQRQFRVTFDAEKVFVPYIVYYFHTYEGQHKILSFANQTGVPALSQPLKNFKNIEVKLPAIEVQKKIASVALSLDGKIELNNRINENLESQAQAIFKSWFVDFEPFGGVKPEEWTEKSVYDLAEYINGAAFKKNEYSTEGIPIIKIAELKNGITDSTQYCRIEKDEKYYFDNKAILFSWSGNPETSIDTFLWYRGKAILNQHTFRVVSKYNASAFTYFLLKYLKPKFTHIASNKQTTGLGHVTVSDLKRLQFSCSTDAIEEFEKMSKPLFDMIYNTYVESNRLSKLRDVLLPKLMNGEIDVSEVKI